MKMDTHERDPTSEGASSLIDEFELLSSEADLIFGVDTKGVLITSTSIWANLALLARVRFS